MRSTYQAPNGKGVTPFTKHDTICAGGHQSLGGPMATIGEIPFTGQVS